MKQILPAVVLSILVHLAVYKVDTGWLKGPDIVLPAPKVVTVTMSYRKPEKKAPLKKPAEKKIKTRKIPKPKPDMIPEIKQPPPEQPDPPNVEEPEESPEESPEEDMEEPESLTHGDSFSNMAVVQDAIPLYKTNSPPRYPMAARKRGYQGTVGLMVLVTAEGRVANIWVYDSSGYKLLDNAALASVKKWAFEPGTKNGKPHEMWVKVPVKFELRKK